MLLSLCKAIIEIVGSTALEIAHADGFVLRSIIVAGWITQILGLILIAALLSARPRSLANRLLALVLFCAVYRQFLLVMTMSETIESFPFLFRTSFPLSLLAIPAFYLYVKALTGPEFKIQPRHAVHLVPFLIGIAWYSAVWVWGSPALFELGPAYNRDRYIRVAVKVLVVIPYLILSRRQVGAFALEVKDHVSDISRLRLNWLSTLLMVAYCSLVVDALDVATGPGIPVWTLVPVVGLISLILLTYMSLRVSPLFAREAEQRKADAVQDIPEIPDTPEVEQAIDPRKGRLSDMELARQKARLSAMLEGNALYLNPELRLSDLAEALGLRPYRVSEILNHGLQTSFYDLINRYRVAKAQELLCSPASAHLNLLGIAMESGFRSKSVFNDVFKKVTGKTPSHFRADKTARIA
jgi:AraC-like DNA-binding protein